MRKIQLLLLLGGLLWTATSWSQTTSTSLQVPAKAQLTYAEYLGSIPPVRTLIPVPPTDPERRRQGKKPFAVPENFIGRGRQTLSFPTASASRPIPCAS